MVFENYTSMIERSSEMECIYKGVVHKRFKCLDPYKLLLNLNFFHGFLFEIFFL